MFRAARPVSAVFWPVAARAFRARLPLLWLRAALHLRASLWFRADLRRRPGLRLCTATSFLANLGLRANPLFLPYGPLRPIRTRLLLTHLWSSWLDALRHGRGPLCLLPLLQFLLFALLTLCALLLFQCLALLLLSRSLVALAPLAPCLLALRLVALALLPARLFQALRRRWRLVHHGGGGQCARRCGALPVAKVAARCGRRVHDARAGQFGVGHALEAAPGPDAPEFIGIDGGHCAGAPLVLEAPAAAGAVVHMSVGVVNVPAACAVAGAPRVAGAEREPGDARAARGK